MQVGKRRGFMEGNSLLYIWKKSRFHLTDGHGTEDGKFILNILNIFSRSACGNNCRLADREEASGVVGGRGLVFTGHSIPR